MLKDHLSEGFREASPENRIQKPTLQEEAVTRAGRPILLDSCVKKCPITELWGPSIVGVAMGLYWPLILHSRNQLREWGTKQTKPRAEARGM